MTKGQAESRREDGDGRAATVSGHVRPLGPDGRRRRRRDAIVEPWTPATYDAGHSSEDLASTVKLKCAGRRAGYFAAENALNECGSRVMENRVGVAGPAWIAAPVAASWSFAPGPASEICTVTASGRKDSATKAPLS